MRLVFVAMTAIIAILFVSRPASFDTADVSIGDETLIVDVADDPEKRILGLSGRESLNDIDGMIFIFESSEIRSIWMRGMSFSIDVIWIDERFRIVGSESDVRPDTFPMGFHSPSPVRYILELESGSVERLAISIGDEVELSGL